MKTTENFIWINIKSGLGIYEDLHEVVQFSDDITISSKWGFVADYKNNRILVRFFTSEIERTAKN